MTEEALRKKIVNIIKKHLPHLNHIYLFGSRSSVKFKGHSDYDICIDAGEKIRGDIMQFIRDEFEVLKIMQKIDISDFYGMSSVFRNEVMSKGIVLE